MPLLWSIILFLYSTLSVMIASSVKPMEESNLEETVILLKQKLTEMEGKMLLENTKTADVIQVVKDELLVAVKDAERKSLETKSQLLAKMEELETESRNNRKDFSARLQELRQWTTEQRDEVLKRVIEVQVRCEESTMDVSEKLRNAESKFTKIDNQLLVEVLHLKTMSYEAEKKMSSVEQEFTSVLERERLNTNTLEAEMTEITSQLQSVDVIRKNMSVLADDLRLQLNKNLTFGFENINSNLTAKMRIFENSSFKHEKEYANISYVSMLHENLKSLERSTKNEMENLQSELTPRIEQLEEKSALWDDVPEMKQTLGNHTSELNRLNQLLLDFHKTCDDEPPSVLNGSLLLLDRNPGSIARYECHEDFVLIANSTVRCIFRKWVGRPPVCMPLSAAVNLVTSNPTSGSPLQVDCTTEGPPETKVTWQFGDSQVVEDDRRRFLVNHTLFIANAGESDTGEYTCTAQYHNNVATSSVYVEVKGLPTEPSCIDHFSSYMCSVVVDDDFSKCDLPFYKEQCCMSCYRAGGGKWRKF